MNGSDRVLVAIINHPEDLDLARNQHWYRIPTEQVEKLKQRGGWQPQWLAFYQTKVFGAEAYTITYYAKVEQISQVSRWELFPDRLRDAKSEQRYYKLSLSTLQRLTRPIASNRLRRITFIPTTLRQLEAAQDICDLLRNGTR